MYISNLLLFSVISNSHGALSWIHDPEFWERMGIPLGLMVVFLFIFVILMIILFRSFFKRLEKADSERSAVVEQYKKRTEAAEARSDRMTDEFISSLQTIINKNAELIAKNTQALETVNQSIHGLHTQASEHRDSAFTAIKHMGNTVANLAEKVDSFSTDTRQIIDLLTVQLKQQSGFQTDVGFKTDPPVDGS